MHWTVILTLNHLETDYVDKNPGMFHQKPYFSFDRRKQYINILDDMGGVDGKWSDILLKVN